MVIAALRQWNFVWGASSWTAWVKTFMPVVGHHRSQLAFITRTTITRYENQCAGPGGRRRGWAARTRDRLSYFVMVVRGEQLGQRT